MTSSNGLEKNDEIFKTKGDRKVGALNARPLKSHGKAHYRQTRW